MGTQCLTAIPLWNELSLTTPTSVNEMSANGQAAQNWAAEHQMLGIHLKELHKERHIHWSDFVFFVLQ